MREKEVFEKEQSDVRQVACVRESVCVSVYERESELECAGGRMCVREMVAMCFGVC